MQAISDHCRDALVLEPERSRVGPIEQRFESSKPATMEFVLPVTHTVSLRFWQTNSLPHITRLQSFETFCKPMFLRLPPFDHFSWQRSKEPKGHKQGRPDGLNVRQVAVV